MMSRTYSVEFDGEFRGYKGFNRKFNPASEVDLVALVSVEGEIETWVLDDTSEARTEFVRFLTEEKELYQNASIVGLFKRSK